MSTDQINPQGETFDQWFEEFKADYRIEYGEDYCRGRSPHEMIDYWKLGWDLATIEDYEAWRDYDPV